MRSKVLLGLVLSLFAFTATAATAQTASPISPWIYLTGGNIKTQLASSTVTIPSLAGAPCIGGTSTGTLQSVSCGSGGGGGGTTTTINGVTGPTFTFSATSSSSTLSYTTSTGAVILTIPQNVSFFTNNANYITKGSLSVQAPLVYSSSTGQFSIPLADTATDGYLSASDWNTFNGKQNALTFGDLQGTSNQVNVSGGIGALIGSGATLSLPQDIGIGSNVQFNNITAGNAFFLSGAADGCATFSGTSIISSGSSCLTLAGLSATTPLVYNNGTGVFTIDKASSTADGYLSSTDWSTFNSKQTAGNYLTGLSGDATASGPGTSTLTLATVNSNTGTFGSGSLIPIITANAKGLITAITTSALNAVTSLTGTANQVTASNSTGTVTLSLPQSIATSSSVTFATSTLTNLSVSGWYKDGASATGTSGNVLQSTGTSTRWVATSTLGFATLGGTETLTNKRITQRVVSMADATSTTPTGDTADMDTQANTQSAGTLTVNAPSGTPTDGQKLIIRIKSTNVQTFSWNSIYRGSTDLPLETATTGSSKTDYYGFIYNAADTKWDYMSKNEGF